MTSSVTFDLGLPARLGGLGLTNLSEEAPFFFSSASKVTQPQVEHLLLPDGKELSTALSHQTEPAFTTAGGAGPAASVFLNHLGRKIAKKNDPRTH